MPAAHVDNLVEPGEVVTRRDFLVYDARHATHRVVEDRGVVRVLFKVFPDVHAEMIIESDLAGLDAVHQVSPGGIVLLAKFRNDKPTHRAGSVGHEQFGQRSQREPSVFFSRKHPGTRQCA